MRRVHWGLGSRLRGWRCVVRVLQGHPGSLPAGGRLMWLLLQLPGRGLCGGVVCCSAWRHHGGRACSLLSRGAGGQGGGLWWAKRVSYAPGRARRGVGLVRRRRRRHRCLQGAHTEGCQVSLLSALLFTAEVEQSRFAGGAASSATSASLAVRVPSAPRGGGRGRRRRRRCRGVRLSCSYHRQRDLSPQAHCRHGAVQLRRRCRTIVISAVTCVAGFLHPHRGKSSERALASSSQNRGISHPVPAAQ